MAAADLEQMTKDLERQNRALEAALDERRASPQHAAAPVEAEPFSLHPSGQASARDCSPRTQGSWPGEGRSKPVQKHGVSGTGCVLSCASSSSENRKPALQGRNVQRAVGSAQACTRA